MSDTDVDGGKTDVDADKGGTPPVTPPPEGDKQHPETVPWTQYVGIKEKFTKVEGELTGKVKTLEEQLSKTVSTDEHTKVADELKTAKSELEKVSGELKTIKDTSLSEKKEGLIKRGLPKEKVDSLTETEIDHIAGVLGTVKPGPDLGGGGGGTSPDKAKDKLRSGFETLHPSK